MVLSVLLIILYTWIMLLHQNFTVTTSKPVFFNFCYHIKTCIFEVCYHIKTCIFEVCYHIKTCFFEKLIIL
ncbi:hypothetical protein B9T38_00120 [Acinetobacter sp. ANC 4218]|nr:hypothetical protein B9T38_00120 [Acinetobacter sp. ANC 4218]